MKSTAFLPLCSLACLTLSPFSADAAITLYAEYHLGEPGSVGASNIPLDSVGTKDIDSAIGAASVTVASPGAYAGSTAFLDTSDPANSGYFHASNFSDLANNNFAIGVYAKASALTGANGGTIFSTGDGGFDLSLATNGWAGSVFNVAWVGEAGGTTGSFAADTWTHLALIRADGVTTFYIDSVAQPGTFAGAPTNGLPHLSVSPGGASYFDGGIDEARVVTFDSGEPTTAILSSLTGVPEPSSLALLGIGCAAAFMRRRR